MVLIGSAARLVGGGGGGGGGGRLANTLEVLQMQIYTHCPATAGGLAQPGSV